MSPALEQPSAVRSFYAGAEESYGISGDLHSEVEGHGMRALAFVRAWMTDPAACDPSLIRESFARVTLLHEQLGALIEQQRAALDELPETLVVRDDPGRDAVLEELERHGLRPL